jgi:3-oxoacid CoA-transferase A subunit
MNKVVASAREAIADVKDGASILAGGFGLCGVPENLITALAEKGVRNLTVISNNAGIDGAGLGVLLKNGQIRKMVSSYVGENKEFERQYLSGQLEVELTPQGTLSERIRAGRRRRSRVLHARPGVGTPIAEGKETREYDGRTYVLERAITADFAIVKAWKGDTHGNLVYRYTARNFNPMMATAGRITIAEVEDSSSSRASSIPDLVHTPGVFVQRILRGPHYEKRIEKRTITPKREV